MKHKYFYIILLLIMPLCAGAQQVFTVKQSIDAAFKNNKQLEAAMLEAEREQAAVNRGFNLPKLRLFAEYEGIQGSISNYSERKLGLSQEFEFPTVYFNRADVQSLQADILRARAEGVRNELKNDVKETYAKILYQNALFKITEENLRSYRSFEFTAGRKYEEGAGTNLEVLSARVNRIKYENELRSIESNMLTARAELKALIGTDYDIQVTGELTYKELTLALVQADLVRAALINNSQLKTASLRRQQSDSRHSLAVSELLPDISLTYYNQKIGNTSGYYGFEVGIGIPLFFWLEPSSKIEEAALEYKTNVVGEAYIKKTVESQVIIAHQNYLSSVRQLNFFRESALSEAEEILRTAKGSYDEGAIGYTEYLQSLNIANETRSQYLEALYNYNISIITLERLTGLELL